MASNEVLKYGHPLAQVARTLAHHGTYGSKDQVVICENAKARHLLAIVLLDWCGDMGWFCSDWEDGHFSLRRGEVYIVSEMPAKSFDGVSVRTLTGAEYGF